MTQTKRQISDAAQARADFTGEVHLVLGYTDGLVVTRPISQVDLVIVDSLEAALASGVKSIKVFPPKGQFSGMSAAQIVEAAR